MGSKRKEGVCVMDMWSKKLPGRENMSMNRIMCSICWRTDNRFKEVLICP